LNFVKNNNLIVRLSRGQVLLNLLLFTLLSLSFAGCSDQVRPSSARQLAQFENAGPVHPTEQMDRLMKARILRGAYRVMPGEVLELTMPAILQVVTAEKEGGAGTEAPYMCRVSEKGAITLPVVGELDVAGKTLTQIESIIIDAYYPKYAVSRPSVFVRLVEQVEQLPFVVIGLVNKPGSFEYPYNIRYNVMQAIGFAGGLNQDLEPRYAMVYRLTSDGKVTNATFHVAHNSKLEEAMTTYVKPGDIIAVEHTPRTRTNAFLNRMFRINIGTYVSTNDLWND
jgi:protein involved in polysaccharide export with SLBB domain